MSNEFPDLPVRLLFETVCHPVRDRHPRVAVASVPVLFAGTVMVSRASTRRLPDSPF